LPKGKKHKDFESAASRLEEITEELESGQPTLEESITLYTEGIEIVAFCNSRLSEAEKKIKLITEKDGKVLEELFEEKESD